jgi:hypothetical protein
MPGVDFTQFDHVREEHAEQADEATKASPVGSELKWD